MNAWGTSKVSFTEVSEEFLLKLKDVMPPQPWKPGVNRKICDELKCSQQMYISAVEQLIAEGYFLRQRDGVLYDSDGNVVSFDSERVDPETLELRTDKA